LEDYDNETYNFDEYDAAMKEFEAKLAREELEKQQAIIKRAFITSKGDERDQAMTDSQAPAAKDPQAAGAQDTLPLPAATPTEELSVIHGGPRPTLPMLSKDRPAQDFITPMDNVMYGSLLIDSITPEHFKDISDLDKKRRDILKDAKYIKEKNKKLYMDIRKMQHTIKCARNLEEKYNKLLQENIKSDPRLIQNLGFVAPEMAARLIVPVQNPPYYDKIREEVMATPIENIEVAVAILENDPQLLWALLTNVQSTGTIGKSHHIAEASL
jgi:hypothetical protein